MAFQNLEAVIADGIDKRLHTCVQVCISVDGQRALNAGIGLAAADQPATEDTMMLWRSAGKPLTAIGIMRLAEQGVVSVSDAVGLHLPATHGTVYADLTLAQLMSHSTGLPLQQTLWPNAHWNDIIDSIIRTSDSIQPGLAAYQPQATWFLLGEILRQQCAANSFSDALHDTVLAPLNMHQASCGICQEWSSLHPTRLPQLFDRRGKELQPSPLTDGPALHAASPGGNMRGPVSELVQFYEMLLRRGTCANGSVFLSEQSIDLLTAVHRRDLFDQTFQHKIDFGLGVITSSLHHGPAVPYGFGRYASPGAFGHGGAQCSMGFCDPAHGLAVAWAANGFCSEPQHQRRNTAINEAIYKDLGLAA